MNASYPKMGCLITSLNGSNGWRSPVGLIDDDVWRRMVADDQYVVCYRDNQICYHPVWAVLRPH